MGTNRLTNYQRDAFIRAVMDDVPKIDYNEEIRKIAVEHVVSLLPAPIQAVWAKPELREWIQQESIHIGDTSVYVPSLHYHETRKVLQVHCKSLIERQEIQHKQRSELQTRLRSVAYGVTTRKQLAEALPEFAKYLPPDEAAAVRSLPVVANVVAEFVKAGWPKEKAT